ncbi:T9SS type A sorting domain-containing protein [Panacibacter sp. DH6]|uniref:T9SS type A sorting domain-containing protein n=1 Tax=Panacibacter microcysteis TaxID=2793269 RepID=A0A931H0B2_9BACT|nr:choice-of-anchor tandem repeat GloVer-containing protein [Panacibacter microcysteis]MBG9378660.1 T9SS type A sorting domain-containing protein [Panacibacter microcysteis]
MAYLFTKTPNALKRTTALRACLLCYIALSSFFTSQAQDVLAGLTSNGGADGLGTMFTIKTNGSAFAVLQNFIDYGKAPQGDLFKDTDGNFYGMTCNGGTYNQGTIFKMTPGGVVTILRHLNSPVDGGNPYGELIKGTDGFLYGVTSGGGNNTYGTIFKIMPDGSSFTVLRHLTYATDGTNPRGHLVQANDGNFYGITYGGGANGLGTIFKITPTGTFTTLKSFNSTTDGNRSYNSLTPGTDGNLYGITYYGGTYGYGTIFKITTAGVYTVIKSLNGPVDGGYSQSDLVQGKDGLLYGTCSSYGTYGNGTIFKVTTTGTFTVLRHLASGKDGGYPYGGLYQNTDGTFYGLTRTGGTGSAGTAYKITSAGVYTVLHSFLPDTEGSTPNGAFTKGNDNNLYAMTSTGGTFTFGTAFKMTTAGAVTTLVKFNESGKGNIPMESLVKGTDSAYYGTTREGGTYNHGTIFKRCGNTFTILKSLNKSVDGGYPQGSLIQATDGSFYGMCYDGGTSGYGTIFKITAGGVYKVLKHFTGIADGGNPTGSLVQATDGFLYGMTRNGGSGGGGVAFKISTAGVFTLLHTFVYATEGSNPEGDLLQATDGNFYGMTTSNGRIFKMTSTGTVTVLKTFVSGTDGYIPFGSLIQAKDGKLYGMTTSGGTYSYGTIFNITTTGTYKVMKHFNPTPDGKVPKGKLLQANDGSFYGLTSAGGTNNAGTIFKITTAGAYSVLKHFAMAADGGNPFGSLVIAPVNNLVANAQNVTTNEDVAKAITLTGSGGSPLTFAITTQPKRGKLTGTGAVRTYTPNANVAGKDSFAFSVSIGCIASAPAMVRITINAVADTPVLASIGNKSVVKNSNLTFTATATDADAGQKITYSLIGAPAGASINSTTGVFTWTPATAGNFSFKVRATDNSTLLLYDEESITVTVTNTLTAITQSAATAIAEEKTMATIYPNPVHDKAYITLNASQGKVTVRILDVNGKAISANVYDAGGKNRIDIDAAQLSRGIYFAEVQTPEGRTTLRFIKQ